MLPPIVLLNVFKFIDVVDRCRCRHVCLQWKDIIDSQNNWPLVKLGFYIGNGTDFEVPIEIVYLNYWPNLTDRLRLYNLPREIQ